MKRALIIGLGLSGRSAAAFLMRRGYSVTATDKNLEQAQSHAEAKELEKKGLLILDAKTILAAFQFDLVIVSPGVPPTDMLYAQALKDKVEIIGEAELALRQMKKKAVAITGTNGKTTVTLLVEHVLNESGLKAKALGNVGDPLTGYFLDPEEARSDEIIVAELSSYQLETMDVPVFDAAVLLNITPDHLDRYGNMTAYARAKCGIERCLKPGSPLYVYQVAADEFGSLFEKREFYTFGTSPRSDFWTDKEKVYQKVGPEIDGSEKVEYLLPPGYRDEGSHESENALAAWLLVRQLGVTPEQFIRALKSFHKPPHRIEFITKIGGVAYYDDSKGTNLDAVIRAVAGMPSPVVLIAGGVDKGASYKPWIEAFQSRVKRIVAMGQAAAKIKKELAESIEVEIVGSMDEAVCRASEQAEKGGSVLLSPGCASFDMFRDYAHRGEEFKRCVKDLEERSEKHEP